MLQTRQPVPLVGAKRGSFRYNRRDVQFDELFEAVSPSDARVLIQAKLAREATPAEVARARAATAARADDRSSIAEDGAGIPTTSAAVLERKVATSTDAPAELRADPTELPPPAAPEIEKPAVKKKRVRNRRKPVVGDPPAQS